MSENIKNKLCFPAQIFFIYGLKIVFNISSRLLCWGIVPAAVDWRKLILKPSKILHLAFLSPFS